VIAALLDRIPVSFCAVYAGGIALLEYLAVDCLPSAG
jgi:threonine/homoserine/homoserine lactone efflux protein